MLTLSYDNYDNLIECFSNYGTPSLIPTPEQVDIMASDPDKYLRFALYLSECGPTPENDTEQYGRQLLTQFLYDHVTLVEDEVH